MQQVKTIKILISYDQCMVAEGFESVLSSHKRFQVSLIRKNKDMYYDTIRSGEVDLLIVEIEDVSRDSLNFITKLHHDYPMLKILVISGIPPLELLKPLVNVINGYLLRSCSSEKLFLAIQEIFEAGKYICSKLIPILFNDNKKDNFNIHLTSREKEILL